MMFKKGSFEIDTTFYPVAIKYNPYFGDAFWNNLHLVALDIETGQVIWDRPAKPLPGISIVSLVAAEGKLVLQTSNNGVFAVYVFNADTGEMEWRSNYQWETDHHGKHLSRPLVVKGRMYLRPLTIDLKNGDVLRARGGHEGVRHGVVVEGAVACGPRSSP